MSEKYSYNDVGKVFAHAGSHGGDTALAGAFLATEFGITTPSDLEPFLAALDDEDAVVKLHQAANRAHKPDGEAATKVQSMTTEEFKSAVQNTLLMAVIIHGANSQSSEE